MSRRIARKRLYKLQEKGTDLTSTAGGAISSNIGSQSRLRDGELITTDITIDLAAAAGAAHSFTIVGVAGQKRTISAVGVSSSSGTHGSAQVMLVNGTASAADSIGILTGGELMCVETPQGGGANLGLYYASNLTSSGDAMDLGTAEVAVPLATQVIGTNTSVDVDVDTDNMYLYLVHSGAVAGNYTAGKFVLRLYGYDVFDDV